MDAGELFDNMMQLMAAEMLDLGIVRIETFRDAGILSNNLGLVITDEDGERHQFEMLGTYGRV